MSGQEKIDMIAEKLDNHLEKYNKYILDQHEITVRQDTAHEKNMEAIAALTKSTQGVVDAWVAAATLQKLMKWLSGFAVIGAALAWYLKHFPTGGS